jgi:integrase
MAVYKRGGVWWYKFNWNGRTIRASTKVTNKRTAEQIEAARKTEFAKGEVGFRDRKPVPTLGAFLEGDFLPFVRATKAGKPNTVRFYENSVTNLKGYSKLAGLPMDQITAEHIGGFVAHRQLSKVQVSTLNRDLATLRRGFHLAQEWGKVSTILPRVRLLPGENHRERVLSGDEEAKYLEAATSLGHEHVEAYQRALEGIRATQRGQQPKQPDAFLLRDVAIILADCGLRPEECFRLKWMENIRDGAIEIHTGKGRGSRRRIPISPRVRSILDMRRTGGTSAWVFPAPTKSGHIESSSLKKQHAEAVKASGVVPFVLYTFRHTCITRWAKHMDPFTLHVLAGHTDMNTTKRYVHPSDEDILEAMERVRGGHKYGHTLKIADPGEVAEITGKLLNEGEISGATRRDRTGDLLITNQPLYQLS